MISTETSVAEAEGCCGELQHQHQQQQQQQHQHPSTAGLEPLHLPGKEAPSGSGHSPLCFGDNTKPKVTANGVHDIEDRILRITGYYGYYPGYSSHRSK